MAPEISNAVNPAFAHSSLKYLHADSVMASGQVLITSMMGFFVCYYGIDWLLQNILKPRLFLEMSRKDQADFLSRVTAQIHAVIATYLANNVIFKYCSSGLPLYVDNQCFIQGGFYPTIVVIFSTGYIVFDLIIILFEIKDYSALGIQNIVHHFISILASSSCAFGGGPLSSAAGATVMTEISTIVLHIRFYLIKYKKTDGLPFYITMIVFIGLFAWSRVWILPQVSYKLISISLTNEKVQKEIYTPVLVLGNIMMAAIQLLNFYWFIMILAGVHRVWTKGLKEAKSGTRDAEQELSSKNGSA